MKYFATIGSETIPAERTPDGAVVGENELALEFELLGPGDALLRTTGRSARVTATRTATGWDVAIGGRTWSVQLESERARAIRELTGHDEEAGNADLRAPMPGLVVKVLVAEGQSVEEGDGLVVVEAMKMENELRAEGRGTIAHVDVSPGSTVDRDQVLIRFEAEAS